MVSRNTTLVPSLGLHLGPACEAGLSAGMRRERVAPQRRKKEEPALWNTKCTDIYPGILHVSTLEASVSEACVCI